MNLIFAQRRVGVRTRHFARASVHTFYIMDTAIVLARDAYGFVRPVFMRCVFAVSHIEGGDVCLA